MLLLCSDANRARDDSDLTVRRGVWNHLQYSSLIYSEFIRAGRYPTATGWDQELRARTACVRLQRQGRSESSFTTEDGSIRMSGHALPQVPIGNRVTGVGGPELVRNGQG